MMNDNSVSIGLKSYAKINLSLDVKGVTDDGMHLVEMVMQQILLCDDIAMSWTPGADGLEIEVHDLSTGAMADGAHALTPDQFGNVMERVRLLREIVATHEKEHA